MSETPTPVPLIGRLAALAEPARLRLLALLEGEELAVSELAEILQLPQSTVSRHLKQLSDEGWLVVRGERTANFYRMANGELPEPARRIWEVARGEIAGWPALAHDRLRLERTLAGRRGDSSAFFAGVANADPSQKAIILSKGISEAMNCTAFGLGNAVPGLLLYAMLQARTQHVIDGINESVVSTLNLVLANRQLFKNVNLEGTGTPAPAKARA